MRTLGALIIAVIVSLLLVVALFQADPLKIGRDRPTEGPSQHIILPILSPIPSRSPRS